MTTRENVLLALLIVSVGGNVSQIVADLGDSDPEPAAQAPRSAPPETSTATATATAPSTATEPEQTAPAPTEPATTTEPEESAAGSGGTPACRDVEIPARPTEAVTCRTASAVLTIVDQAKPLLLGDTHVRVQSASAEGRTVALRVRVRNETDAEQGIQAGGQELYLNVNGIRVDPEPVREERVPPLTGKTISMRFVLTPGRARVLERLGRRAELGVRPWTAGEPTTSVGVIRFSLDD